MSRYHHLVIVHAENADLITANIQAIVDAIKAGELSKAQRMVMALQSQSDRMETAFEEMSLLVRVMMLEFQVDDDKHRSRSLPQPRPKASVSNRQREVQLELFALWTEIQAKRRADS